MQKVWGGGRPHRAAFPCGHRSFPPLTCSCLSRITRSGLRFNPAFPDGINRLKVNGVSYLGNKLEFTITRGEIRIEVTESPREPPPSALEAVLEESGQRLPLREGTVPSPRSAPRRHGRLGRNRAQISHGLGFVAGRSVSFPTAAGWIQRSPTETF